MGHLKGQVASKTRIPKVREFRHDIIRIPKIRQFHFSHWSSTIIHNEHFPRKKSIVWSTIIDKSGIWKMLMFLR